MVNTVKEDGKVSVSIQALSPPGDPGNFKAVIVRGENHPIDSTVSFELSCTTWVLALPDALDFLNQLTLEINNLDVVNG